MSADQSRPVPRAPEVEGIDRAALRAVLRDIDTDAYFDQRKPLDEQVDRILALVGPVEGYVLTREEAALVVKLVRLGFAGDGSDDPPASALAARLEAAQ